MATRGDRPLPVERRHRRPPRAHDGTLEPVADDARVQASLDFLHGLVATITQSKADAVRTRAVLAAEEAAATWRGITTAADFLEAVADELDEYATTVPSAEHGRSLRARLVRLDPAFRVLLPNALPDLIGRWQAARLRKRGRPKAGAPPTKSTTEILHELLVAVGLTAATPESVRRIRRPSARSK